MWKKIEKTTGRNGAEPRKVFAVQRHPKNPRAAKLLVPDSYPFLAEQIDIYSDDNGRVAFCPAKNGAYRVSKPTKAAKTRTICIPASLSSLIPYGTTDIRISEEGGMLVVDTSQFSAPKFTAQAAE